MKQQMKRLDSDVGAMHAGQINPFLVSAEESTSYKYKPRLYGVFETSEDFLNVLEVLEQATENDVVEFHINSGGGSTYAVSTLIHGMKGCEAPIHCVFTGLVASAATFPMFYCDSFEIADDADFLFHEIIIGAPGETMSASKDYTAHSYKTAEKLLRSTYQHFFIEEEMVQLLQGKQFWMEPAEVMKRFNKRLEIMKESDELQ